MESVELVVLGVGAGSTCTYFGECSSSFVICMNGSPVLMLDVGLGAVRAALHAVGALPQHLYVSHNHTDHAGELPVLLAVESAAGRTTTLLAAQGVMDTLTQHRLAELTSTGQPLSHFAHMLPLCEGQLTTLPCGLALTPLRSRHAERCFGLLLHWRGRPLLGWTADSGANPQLFSQLAAAPVVLLDGRDRGSSEHSGFDELQAAAAHGVLRDSQCYVYGYGRLAEAPDSRRYPKLAALTPGQRLNLAQAQLEPPPVAAEACVCQPA